MITYLLINLGIIAGPLLFSFEKNVRFYKKIKYYFLSLIPVNLAFIIWDAIATANGTWSFNPAYTLGIKLFGLPFEEILFFITVPYSTIFIYESISFYLKEKKVAVPDWFYLLCIALLALLAFIFREQNYTLIVMLFCIVFFLFQFSGRFRIFNQLNFLITIAVSFIPFFIVNFLLTSIPVVLYNDKENWGIRVTTIPAEDFFYSFAMISLWIMFYRYFRDKKEKSDIKDKDVIIIGSGLGGLTAALRLQHAGYNVSVFEQNESAGGKAGLICKEGFKFDTGPSLLTMPFVLEELFRDVGLELKNHLRLVPLKNICRYFYKDGTVIKAWHDKEKFGQEIEAKTSDKKESVSRFLAYSKRIYDLTADLFLLTPFQHVTDFLNKKGFTVLSKIWQIDPFRTMNAANKSFFNDSRTLQIFNRYATYNGSNPYKVPATLNIIPHVEYTMGSFTLKGGIYEIPQSIYKAAVDKGVKFYFNSKVSKIIQKNGEALGVIVNDKEIHASLVISNVDYWNTEKNLLNKPVKVEGEFSTSAVIFYWGVKGISDNLEMHNIIFSGDYKKEFNEIFEKKRIPEDPTIYIYISSKLNADSAPKGHENWFVMVNTPPGVYDKSIDLVKLKGTIINNILKTTGIDLKEKIVFEEIATPETLERKTGSLLGSIYGLSSNDRNAAFKRPSVKSKDLENLYYCGGSIHPGGGIPLAVLSGKHCADTIIKTNDKTR